MAAIQTLRTDDEVARLGNEFIRSQVLKPEDKNKFIAVAVDHHDYEVNEDDYTAVSRLRDRHPSADIWLGRIGHETAYKLRAAR